MLPEAGDQTAEANAAELVRQLKDLADKIPELLHLEAGTDLSRTPASFDVGLYTKFATLDDLETYRVHPDHQRVVEYVKKVTGDRAVVDFEE